MCSVFNKILKPTDIQCGIHCTNKKRKAGLQTDSKKSKIAASTSKQNW